MVRAHQPHRDEALEAAGRSEQAMSRENVAGGGRSSAPLRRSRPFPSIPIRKIAEVLTMN